MACTINALLHFLVQIAVMALFAHIILVKTGIASRGLLPLFNWIFNRGGQLFGRTLTAALSWCGRLLHWFFRLLWQFPGWIYRQDRAVQVTAIALLLIAAIALTIFNAS